jgi:DNA repair protein NreA
MSLGKSEYLRILTTSTLQGSSISLGRELEGTTPPSVFIGSANYPNVYAGPLITPEHGDTSLYDHPERWIPSQTSQEEIIRYRFSLIRGKRLVNTTDINSRYVSQLQEIALSGSSVEGEAAFDEVPTGFSLSEDHAPYGPSATIEKFSCDPVKWNNSLEKVYDDTDLRANEAIIKLHRQNVPFSSIQKAFSVGTMGYGKNRHLVPTRWSITACDSAIADNLYKKIITYNTLDTWKVHEFNSLNNHYAVILTPTRWQYEWTEAFIKVLGDEELIFSDYEQYKPKREYSSVGGCYYSCKMAVLEALEREKKQAGVIVLREALHGYVPLGVFNVRENVRNAMKIPGKEFESFKDAFSYASDKLTLPPDRYIKQGRVLRSLLTQQQTRLSDFFKDNMRPLKDEESGK